MPRKGDTSMSIYRKVGIASAILMVSVFLSRVIGLLREMAVAYIGGAQAEVDAYQLAFILPEILNHVLASGFLSVTFIPLFSRHLADKKESEGWKAFANILTVLGTLMVALILAAEWLPPEMIRILAPGITDTATRAAAVRMTRIILPAQFFFFTGSLFMAVQQAKVRFAITALAGLTYNLGIIAGGLLLGPGWAWKASPGVFWGAPLSATSSFSWSGRSRSACVFAPPFSWETRI